MIHPFETLDEVKAHIASLPADPSITPEQAGIGYGDYYIHFIEPSAFTVGFGEVIPPERLIETAVVAGWSESEAIHEATYVIGAHRHHVSGLIHTAERPDGLWADTPRSMVWPIDEPFYAFAKLHKYDPRLFHDLGWAWLQAAFAAYTTATKGTQAADIEW